MVRSFLFIDQSKQNNTVLQHDSYLCTAVDLDRHKAAYIAGFEPHDEMHTAHHMLLFGCPALGEVALASNGKFWNCGDMGSGVCGGVGEKIMYVWGRNAPKLKLPPDVAFEVGGDSGVNYLVLQVHYKTVDHFLGKLVISFNGAFVYSCHMLTLSVIRNGHRRKWMHGNRKSGMKFISQKMLSSYSGQCA